MTKQVSEGIKLTVSLSRDSAQEIYNYIKDQPVEIKRKFTEMLYQLDQHFSMPVDAEMFALGKSVKTAIDLTNYQAPAIPAGEVGEVVGYLNGRIVVRFKLPYLDANQTMWQAKNGHPHLDVYYHPVELEVIDGREK